MIKLFRHKQSLTLTVGVDVTVYFEAMPVEPQHRAGPQQRLVVERGDGHSVDGEARPVHRRFVQGAPEVAAAVVLAQHVSLDFSSHRGDLRRQHGPRLLRRYREEEEPDAGLGSILAVLVLGGA
eukprot:CAMPEP_0198681766 /NCGR_PEP_ID=MMETSP1468-20131203/7454_1 /TAXON_ID=1461545 /ORGANISM="Mantoniella sp, Strain CCMP1436" /LENGTH=123 /DNA_ID=CAMNT_0044423919 /DNA_START=366 /DNA_END=738 /DNA_ORIENTATION=+